MRRARPQVYVVDADFFIQAHYMDYPLVERSTFWQTVKQLAHQQRIVSIDRVKKILARDDAHIRDWCAERLPRNFFRDADPLMDVYRQMVDWAIGQRNHYIPGAIHDFLSADESAPWVVAYALRRKRVVVTYEQSYPDRKDKVRTPDVCNAFGVPCMNTAQMFSNLGISL